MPIIIKILIILVAALYAVSITAISGFGFSDAADPAPDNRLPGAEEFDAGLIKKFEAIRRIKGDEYRPRTKHLRPDGWAVYTNRLFLESSPYLLQHAHNPVNWYPWGKEAFEAAKRLDRPIFLSIGYSTCHWCHVMEAESFEDIEIARYLNENYIAIKVDREERPDIDAIYMSAVQVLTGRGGWPLSVWLTPDQKPFYGGSYFPARDGDRGVNIGFLTLLKRLNETYRQQGDRVATAGRQITEAIHKVLSTQPGAKLPGSAILDQAAQFYRNSYDPKYGGLIGAPKFPSSLPVRFLLRYYQRTGKKDILKMVRRSLTKMAGGGIYDQVGGGFHRYSTDERWLTPHFEKMLYDNALQAMAYLEAYQATGDENFKRIVEEILRYVKRDMTSSEGAFYSATDADSMTPEGRMAEGYFFTWIPEEIEKTVGKDRAEIVKKYFSVTASGNFEGRNILHTERTGAEVAGFLKISEKKLNHVIRDAKEMLYQARKRRPHPLRDEKILTAWNGLMISACARAGLVLNHAAYTDCAAKAARFVLDHLYLNKRLYRSYKDNKARHDAYLNDYAFFIGGLIDLYEASHEIAWLQKAIDLEGVLEKYYADKENGGFFMTASDHENLIARGKPYEDGAIPSGNAVAVLNLLRLGTYTTKNSYRKRAEKGFAAFLNPLRSTPPALSEMLLAVDYYLDDPTEIVIITPRGKEDNADRFLAEFRTRFIPNRIIAVLNEEAINNTRATIPLVAEKKALNGKATAFVCEKGACKLPTNDQKEFARQIQVQIQVKSKKQS